MARNQEQYLEKEQFVSKNVKSMLILKDQDKLTSNAYKDN